LHSKFIIIDDDIGVISSSNMDIRSFELNLEITLVCYDSGVVSDLERVTHEYLSNSNPLHLETWQARPGLRKLLDNLARLTSALQ
jgi:cardiolipin synthase